MKSTQNQFQTQQQPQTPSNFLTSRLRLASVNSPFISPLQIAPSPYIHQAGLFGNAPSSADLNHFQLQENPHENRQVDNEQQNEMESSLIEPQEVQDDNQDIVLIDENNMLDFILTNMGRNKKKMEDARLGLEGYGSEFNKRMFDYLTSKFDKLKKTKQEMVKYSVRKSFKHITNKMRAANKQTYINMENNEVVAEYFQNHCEGDLSISMPFKKNSEEKTMNASFLKKIFKCRQYNVDYREFLRLFPADFKSDNKKKIKSMNECIKKCVRNKCFKSLDEYKRLPWTTQILQKIFEFAKKLMEHSPYKKQQIDQKALQQKNRTRKYSNNLILISQNMEMDTLKVPTKKSVIILTPPIRALQQPEHLQSQELFR